MLSYDTRRKAPIQPADRLDLVYGFASPAAFGDLWSSNFHKNLIVQFDSAQNITRSVQVHRGSGGWVSFARDAAGRYTPDKDVSDRLVPYGNGWRYYDAAVKSLEYYGSQGQLLSISYTTGATLNFTYSTASTPVSVAPAVGLLITVQDQTGRSVQFQYEQPSGVSAPRINQVTAPSGEIIGVAYDAAGNLSQLNWPDGKNRRYLYERNDFPWALTGIIDENATRLATYGYDAEGRATETQWAGGVDRYSASYTTPPSMYNSETYDAVANIIWRDHSWVMPQGLTLTKPNGTTSTLNLTSVQGKPYLSSQDQPAGSGCTASVSSQTYDDRGNVTRRDDFNGTRTCYAADTARNVEVARVEGLDTNADCSAVIAPGATLPAGSRKVSTQWHPDWSLPIQRAEPGKLTTYIYNGQLDPFNSDAVASCAPPTLTLSDGKSTPLLCKQVEQATLDLDGAYGTDLNALQAVPADPSYGNVALLLHMDGFSGSVAFTDSSPNPKVITPNGGALISTAVAKFGSGSTSVRGGYKWLTTPHAADLDLSTGDFTIEMWVYPRSISGAVVLYNKGNSTGYHAPLVVIDSAGHLNFSTHDTGTTQVVNFTGATAISTNTWHHIAVTRNGSTFTSWVDGVLQGTATSAATLRSNSAELVSIGAFSDGSYGFDGWIDEVEVTKGLARHTTTFSVPSSPPGGATSVTGHPSRWNAAVPRRTQSYTYNQYGQVLSAKGPRTDVNDTTTYVYYADTTADHTLGDLQTVTNPAGQVTSYSKYNKHGQVLQSTDPNGVLTVNTYDLRQRLKSTTVAGQTTTYDYDAVGQLKKVTLPDTSWIGYDYDDAHRQVAVYDNQGNRTEYVLDNAGNKTGENVKDPSGNLKRQLSRSIDALGRVQQTTGRE